MSACGTKRQSRRAAENSARADLADGRLDEAASGDPGLLAFLGTVINDGVSRRAIGRLAGHFFCEEGCFTWQFIRVCNSRAQIDNSHAQRMDREARSDAAAELTREAGVKGTAAPSF